MATELASPSRPAASQVGLSGRRYDNYFFSGIALLMLVTAFVGFAPTYYLAGVFHAPLPSRIIHVHAVVFSCWVLLLIAQTSLVSAGRVDIHRRMGIAGMLLACVMVVVGVMAATDSLVRGFNPNGRDIQAFYIVPVTSVLIFGALILLAYLNRSNPAAHKRLILVATTALMVAPLARFPMAWLHRNAVHATWLTYIALLLIVAYDLWSTHRLHRATLWASAFLIFVEQIRIPISHTAAWHNFTRWVIAVGS